MHHLHHAMDRHSANSNFGVLISFWDRLFGTYTDKIPQTDPGEPHQSYTYGVPEYRDASRLNLLLLTLMPFKSRTPYTPSDRD